MCGDGICTIDATACFERQGHRFSSESCAALEGQNSTTTTITIKIAHHAKHKQNRGSILLYSFVFNLKFLWEFRQQNFTMSACIIFVLENKNKRRTQNLYLHIYFIKMKQKIAEQHDVWCKIIDAFRDAPKFVAKNRSSFFSQNLAFIFVCVSSSQKD